MKSDQINELATALSKAQGAMKNAPFDKQNPHYRNSYASLASIRDAIRDPLAANGLSYSQSTEIRDSAFVLVTTLMHSSGQWLSSEYPLPIAAKPQELGSALTYARRYSLSAITCVASDDDDDAEGARVQGQTSSAPAPSEPISPEQVEALQSMIVEVNANIAQFCKYMGVVNLSQIKTSDYSRAVSALEKKRGAA